MKGDNQRSTAYLAALYRQSGMYKVEAAILGNDDATPARFIESPQMPWRGSSSRQRAGYLNANSRANFPAVSLA
jgi:hypothetical protein